MFISHSPTRKPASNRHHKEPPRKRASTGIITRPSPRGWIRPGLDTKNMASTTWHTVEFSRNRRASNLSFRTGAEATALTYQTVWPGSNSSVSLELGRRGLPLEVLSLLASAPEGLAAGEPYRILRPVPTTPASPRRAWRLVNRTGSCDPFDPPHGETSATHGAASVSSSGGPARGDRPPGSIPVSVPPC